MAGERRQRVGIGESREVAAVERGAVREVGDIGERPRLPRFGDALRAGFGEAGDYPEAEAQRRAISLRVISLPPFQRAVPRRLPSRRPAARRRRAGAHPARAATGA